MNLLPFPATLRRPATVAAWLLVAFTAGLLAVMSVPAIIEWKAGEPDVLMMSIPVVAWTVSLAAAAALGARLVRSRTEAWLLVAAEMSVVASTAWLCVVVLSDGRPQNAQAGVGLILLPIPQLAAVASYASAVIGAALIARGCAAKSAGSSSRSS